MTPTSKTEERKSPRRFGFSELGDVTQGAADRGGADLLEWASEYFAGELCMACSMGPEDVVILDLLAERGLVDKVRVFTLDTGRLHQETYELMQALRQRYDVAFDVYTPDTDALQALMRAKGPNSFYDSVDNRRECCGVRKIEPLNRALSSAAAWITGIRKEQNVTRLGAANVELDLANGGLIKVNPLVEWTREDVWNRIRERDIPYNVLHDRGFASIGCAPCTRAIEPGEDERAGRWWWETPEEKECGLHAHKD